MSRGLQRKSGITIVRIVDTARLFYSLKTSNSEKIGAHDDAQNVLVEGFECNVAEETSVKEVFYDIMRTFGKIDAVIASAGM